MGLCSSPQALRRASQQSLCYSCSNPNSPLLAVFPRLCSSRTPYVMGLTGGGVCLLLLWLTLAVVTSGHLKGPSGNPHPDPPNLSALDCAVGKLAAAFAKSRFPNDPAGVEAGVSRALHADGPDCAGPVPNGGYPELQGGYPKPHTPRPGEVAFYVCATQGNDTASGTLRAPFRTVHRARDAVRALPRPRPPVVVFLRAGVHYVLRPLTLGPSDSGTNDASRVVWRPYGLENVTLSGSVPLEGLSWAPAGEGMPPGLYKAYLPHSAPEAFRALTVDGVPAVLARFPNADPRAAPGGLCYSKPQRPGEGCGGYISAGASTGTLPLPHGIAAVADASEVRWAFFLGVSFFLFYFLNKTSASNRRRFPSDLRWLPFKCLPIVYLNNELAAGQGVLYRVDFLCRKFCAKILCAICSVFSRICTGIR